MDNKGTDGTATSEAIRVSIFDQIYSLRSPRGAEHIRQLAHLVDERMRQIAAQTTTFELSRIAVLAALNIADELEDLKGRPQAQQSSLATSPDSSNKAEAAAADNRTSSSSDETGTAQTWFDAIFDAEVPVKDRSERLSSQISTRLQTNRQEDPKASNITVEEDSN